MHKLILFLTLVLSVVIPSNASSDVFIGTWTTNAEGRWKNIRVKSGEERLTVSIKDFDGNVFSDKSPSIKDSNLYWSARVENAYGSYFALFGKIKEIVGNNIETLGDAVWYPAGEQYRRQQNNASRISTDQMLTVVEFKFVPYNDDMKMYFRIRHDFLSDGEYFYCISGDWIYYSTYTNW